MQLKTNFMWAAKKEFAALKIEWDDGPNAKLSTADIVRDMEAASNRPGVIARQDGDFAKGLASARTKVEAVYEVPFLAHAAMEPMNCTVHVREDSCEVWVGTQELTRAQEAAAKTAGLPLEKVTVQQLPARRRLWTTTGDRRRGARGAGRQAGRWPGQGDLDPRGRHPA